MQTRSDHQKSDVFDVTVLIRIEKKPHQAVSRASSGIEGRKYI
jgi:hypothetical protein